MDEMEMSEFVIPKESLGDECKPGDRLTLEVTEMSDDGVSVKFVGKEKSAKPEPSMLEDAELAEAFSGKGM